MGFLTALPLFVIASVLVYNTFREHYYEIETSYGDIIEKQFIITNNPVTEAHNFVYIRNSRLTSGPRTARYTLISIKKID